MADSITLVEFKDALRRYDAVLEMKSQNAKPGSTPLEVLDQFRYIEAPAQFSNKTGRPMDLTTIQKLLEWKLRHGTFRPSLPKLVGSNKQPKVLEVTKDAFDHYAAHPYDIKAAVDKLSVLKGIGPATASLLLAVHDPENVIFFGDEVWAWLCNNGERSGLKYNVEEFEDVHAKSTALASRLGVSPIDIEKVAFVIIRENEPVVEKRPPYQPSGLPRGRPKMAEHEKKPKKEPSGLGRGRPRKPDSEKVVKSPKPRGRPATVKETGSTATPVSTGKGRGRPKKVKEEGDEGESPTPKSAKRKADEGDEAPKGRGRPKKAKA